MREAIDERAHWSADDARRIKDEQSGSDSLIALLACELILASGLCGEPSGSDFK